MSKSRIVIELAEDKTLLHIVRAAALSENKSLKCKMLELITAWLKEKNYSTEDIEKLMKGC